MTIDAGAPAKADVLLSDGSIATVRPADQTDLEALLALHDEVSEQSLRLRFFAANRHAGHTYAEHLCSGDPGVVVLLAEAHGTLLGVASAEIDPEHPDSAEVAFLVADIAHGHGVGTLLLEHLAAACRQRRIRRFTAEVLVENQAMLQVFADAGFPATRKVSEGVSTWQIATDPTESGLFAAEARESVAERLSLQPLLYPSSVAVVGVRHDGGGMGHAVLTSILRGGFTGDLWVIHPSADQVIGVPALPNLTSVPGPVDVLVVAAPAAQVLEVVGDAASRGVSTVVVISSGFAELGPAGARMRRAVLQIAREHDIRILGPNSLGLLCNDPSIRLNATFSGSVPKPGGLALGSQSGGVGVALLDLARERGLGVHSFISLGDQSDVSGADLLAAWHDDPWVTAGALYLEDLGHPGRFARVARRFSEHKPLLAVIGGRSRPSVPVGSSGPAAAATPAVAIDALFAQTGVVVCDSAADLVRTADLLSTQPLPAGGRLGIVTNANGIGSLAADAADAAGLLVPALSAGLQAGIAGRRFRRTSVANPVDLGVDAGAEAFEAAVGALLRSGEVDAVLVAIVATSVADTLPALDALTAVVGRARAHGAGKPVLLVTLGGPDPVAGSVKGVTVFSSPEDAVGSLAHAVRYAAWRTMPRDEWVEHDADRADRARDVARQLTADGPARWLEPQEIDRLLADYGISTVGETARGPQEAAQVAERLGFPVAVKLAAPDVLHKTDRGLVRLGVQTCADVVSAVEDFETELGSAAEVLVQPQRDGVELALGITQHPTFGPLVMVAAGGVTSNLLDDRTFLVPPLNRQDAARALRSLRIWPTLDGYRGAEPVDVVALEELVVALGQVAHDLPEVVELDLNPVLAGPHGAAPVDVKVRVAAASERTSLPRQLTPVETGPLQRAPSTPECGTNGS